MQDGRDIMIERTEYTITKDKDFIGKRCESYTIEKKIIHSYGKVETRTRIFIPFRDGDINKINLDELDFPEPITSEEWEKLSPEYRKAWCNGTLTKELCKERDELLRTLIDDSMI